MPAKYESNRSPSAHRGAVPRTIIAWLLDGHLAPACTFPPRPGFAMYRVATHICSSSITSFNSTGLEDVP